MEMLKREIYLEKIRNFYDSDLIKILVGIRRSGKSVILSQIIQELKEKGIAKAVFMREFLLDVLINEMRYIYKKAKENPNTFVNISRNGRKNEYCRS